MAKLSLTDLLGGSIAQINNNFKLIKNALNDRVLWRNNPNDEPNQMETGLDMNTNRILNLPYPETDLEPLRKIDVMGVVEIAEAVAAAVSASASAQVASTAATNALSAANSASTTANAASAAVAAATMSLASSVGAALIGYHNSPGLTLEQQLDILSSLHVSVREPRFAGGAKGDGSDSSAAIQAAIEYVKNRGGGYVDVPQGSYFLSKTLVSYNNVRLDGAGWTSTLLLRNQGYGDTIYQNTGKMHVTGFFMIHGTMPGVGATALDAKLTDGTAHIRAINTQEAEISGNIIWRMPYGLVLDGAINPKTHHNWFTGIWDPLYSAMQEGIADVVTQGTSQHVQLSAFNHNYHSGAVSAQRNTTYSDGTNNVVKSYISNIGSQFNMLILSGEDIDISNNYLGRASKQLIRFVPGTGSNIILDAQVVNNQLDNVGNGGMGVQLGVDSLTSGPFILSMIIHGNTFNGEYDSNNAIVISSSPGTAAPTVVNLTIGYNSMFAHTATPVILAGAKNAVVSNNIIQNYNSVQAALSTSANYAWNSAVWVTGVCSHVNVTHNIIGGGGNDAGTVSNYCYGGVRVEPYLVNCHSGDNTYTGIVTGTHIQMGTTREESQFVHALAGNYQMLPGCNIYIRNKVTSEASAVNLPIYPVTGCEVLVVDGKGDAATNNLIVGTGDSSTINGSASITLNTAYVSRKFRFNGIQWNVIG